MEPDVEQCFKDHEKVIFVFVMKDFSGYGFKEMKADLGFTINHWNDLSRVAVVGNEKWEEWATKLDNPFGNREKKFFHPEDLDKALDRAEGR